MYSAGINKALDQVAETRKYVEMFFCVTTSQYIFEFLQPDLAPCLFKPSSFPNRSFSCRRSAPRFEHVSETKRWSRFHGRQTMKTQRSYLCRVAADVIGCEILTSIDSTSTGSVDWNEHYLLLHPLYRSQLTTSRCIYLVSEIWSNAFLIPFV